MARRKVKRAPKVPVFIWVLLGALVLAALYRFAIVPASGGDHPEPRPGLTNTIMASERFAQAPYVARVYKMAAAVPGLLDGLYCYCQCSKHAGHRSLLTCFETEHGASCNVCMDEVVVAYTMSQNGSSLQQIRDAIDARYGT